MFKETFLNKFNTIKYKTYHDFQLKELLNKDITVELYNYYKEQLENLYNQLSPNSDFKPLKDNIFIDFVNRSNVYVFVNEKIQHMV